MNLYLIVEISNVCIAAVRNDHTFRHSVTSQHGQHQQQQISEVVE